MNPLHNDSMEEFKADAMAIASAYQAATDEDTRVTMNAMSDQSQVESLKFYIVPSSWFRKAWPILTARTPDAIPETWRDHIGVIPNAELMEVEREVSSSEEEGDEEHQKRFEALHRRMARNRVRALMKPGMRHIIHFFLVGPCAWMLLKEKFGFDGYELARSCVLSDSGNTLAIKLLPGELQEKQPSSVEIGPSGRLAYERVPWLKKGSPTTSAVVPTEEEGNNEMDCSDPAQAPSDNDNDNSPPVLLLPPSTTSQTGTNDSYPFEDRMNVEPSDNTTAVSTPATTVGRKRLSSGLGSLGNTCFMNSSLQCLAHTEPLRRYFLSGNYEADLNTDNPLGTGGELATQFATLLSDMWGIPAKRRNVIGTQGNFSNYSSAVYPRSFKYCLGKHAEQFMGYDQHDSQELMTYLLDALHEDTNRVTKKPYVAKPEQGEDESDDVAAKKAWDLHLKREDSKVLENFMGQVKSRLECCQESCNRVSTTFDPFMYLSVPIPGASSRTLKVTFVPLDPNQRMKNVTLTVNKTSTMQELMAKLNEELVRHEVSEKPIPLHDLCPADVWSHEVFSWYQTSSEIDRIRESDVTYIYELQPLSEVQEASKQQPNDDDSLGLSKTQHRYKLDVETMTRLNKEDDWQTELEHYVEQPTLLFSLFNPRRSTVEERIDFLRKLEEFIDICHKAVSEDETSGTKRAWEDTESDAKSSESDAKSSESTGSLSDEILQCLQDKASESEMFKTTKSRHDIAVLEFCSNKLRRFVLNLIREKRSQYTDGIVIQVAMRRPQHGSDYGVFASPIVLRIPSGTTVYGLREILARRLSRSLQLDDTMSNGDSEMITVENGGPVASKELQVIRQVPLTYDRKGLYGSKSSVSNNKQLGMLQAEGTYAEPDGESPKLALSTDTAEQAIVADVVGPYGTVTLDWPTDMNERVVDATEFEVMDSVGENQQSTERNQEGKKLSVRDCIEKYCQIEQLDESEMWYCNHCKDHVRAWKQFHLYRLPPILIVHLKRFYYSATTHRRDKITTFIDFPLKGLDLTDLVSHYEDGQDPIYDCYAVSNHYGGLGGGHYTAYTLGDDGVWCHYDDTRVTNDIDPKEVVSEAAYVLYYRRRDLPVGEDRDYPVHTEPVEVGLDPPATVGREGSEISSNNTDQAGDDDMAVEGDESSRTGSSPIASISGEPEPNIVELSGAATDPDATEEFPLQ